MSSKRYPEEFMIEARQMVKLSDLFSLEYPKSLVFGHFKDAKGTIPFVTSKGTNNGIAGRVASIPNAKLYEMNQITVPLKGTVMQAHLQTEPFYCAHQIAILRPLVEMSISQMLFYVAVLRSNKHRYSYGRQADKTLKDILIPDISDLPDWVNGANTDILRGVDSPATLDITPKFDTRAWRPFKYQDVFEIKKGKRLTKAEMNIGLTPFVGSTDSSNGLTAMIGQQPIHSANTISLSYNGSVAEAFYQPTDFWATDDVNVLYPKFKNTPAISLFLCTLIRQEKYRYNYGRKWSLEKMKQSTIKLPVKTDRTPDWGFMENYIKTLPYSSQI